MPELPEVETIKLGLQKYVVGKTIVNVEIRLKKMLNGDPKSIIGAKVLDVRRLGKGLILDLNNGYSIAIHVKLTGQLIYRGPEIPKNTKLSKKVGLALPNKFTHVIFKLKSQNSKVEDAHLYYNDLRQFGWIKILKTDEIKTLPFFKEMGPEPFKDLSLDVFKQIVGKGNTAIKVLLMDQKKISGIGNIYANEALFDAKIHPERKAKDLSDKEIEILYNSILKVLKIGLETGGASELQYVNVLGEEGSYQNHFLVYAQDGKPCPRKNGTIKKIMLGGRGTYFCEQCQR